MSLSAHRRPDRSNEFCDSTQKLRHSSLRVDRKIEERGTFLRCVGPSGLPQLAEAGFWTIGRSGARVCVLVSASAMYIDPPTGGLWERSGKS
jgi:hypothetical protein